MTFSEKAEHLYCMGISEFYSLDQKEFLHMAGDRSKVRCYKEQYCKGTWNVRNMYQGKLEVVKQEMARVNVHILEISNLKWTRMGEFNLDDQMVTAAMKLKDAYSLEGKL